MIQVLGTSDLPAFHCSCVPQFILSLELLRAVDDHESPLALAAWKALVSHASFINERVQLGYVVNYLYLFSGKLLKIYSVLRACKATLIILYGSVGIALKDPPSAIQLFHEDERRSARINLAGGKAMIPKSTNVLL